MNSQTAALDGAAGPNMGAGAGVGPLLAHWEQLSALPQVLQRQTAPTVMLCVI